MRTTDGERQFNLIMSKKVDQEQAENPFLIFACLPSQSPATFHVGYFCYPLFYARASEQLFRVVEAALCHKVQSHGASGSANKVVKQVDWLIEEGELTAEEGNLSHTLRQLRNSASHTVEHYSTSGTLNSWAVGRDGEPAIQ